MNTPFSTLFLLQSLDGKISTGCTNNRDFDVDIPTVPGVCEGLHQYYDLEKETDLFSLCSGKTLAKIGWNDDVMNCSLKSVTFVVVDNFHITKSGVRNLAKACNQVIFITGTNKYAADDINADNVHVIHRNGESLRYAFEILYKDFGCDRLTVQCGGTLTAQLLREKLIDTVKIVVLPMLIGGDSIPTSVSGHTSLFEIGVKVALTNVSVTHLRESYLCLDYKVNYLEN